LYVLFFARHCEALLIDLCAGKAVAIL